jgi:uncharacterized membrane protein (DUF2068 family)
VKKNGKKDAWLLLIGSVKMLKAVLLIAFAVGALKLLNPDFARDVARWIRDLNVDAENPVFQTFPDKIEALSPGKISLIGGGALVYAGLFTTEGVGLLLRKRWGEIFTIIITSSFLPFEIYHLVKEFSVFKIVLLIANAAVVVYLIWRVRHEKKRGT